ncbi:uncharacterized protein LOC106161315 isoform X2 [Lingula anatina]|uniref:Uncharacterized protein LOC106161315 isoform X2 n=1 Tax=Lingula anatina TaxID=7574 RepID=A0A1S3I601_LINAN|nr:uncharacterized protein LOC106161315 isoform X2 [Lingula anatina]XP_023931600.1 uncharacterized protein LOC106161315 isoform X2 [Lingula anatina]|eukprot:XP_013393684.1 uncharacterized protein LOC106161315 isoform X2 [Lingula anatina]
MLYRYRQWSCRLQRYLAQFQSGFVVCFWTRGVMADETTCSTITKNGPEHVSDGRKGKGKSASKNPKSVEKSSSEDNIMSLLVSLKASVDAQDGRLENIVSRIDNMEAQYSQYDDEVYVDNECVEPEEAGTSGEKRKLDSYLPDTEDNLFKHMAKKFNMSEEMADNVDDVLAKTVNDLFMNGLDEQHLNELIKQNHRPGNCDYLQVVKTNQLIWDQVPGWTKANDRKMQNIAHTLVKGANILVKTVNQMALYERNPEKDTSDHIGSMIENCNDVLALMGHMNRQINMTRKDFLKPQLSGEYAHLCSHELTYSQKFLFGDDLPKMARDIEDCSKIKHKLFDRSLRGRRGRGARGRGSVYRGVNRPTGGGRPRVWQDDPGAGPSFAKNYVRRGQRNLPKQ